MTPNRWWLVVTVGVGALAVAIGAIFLGYTPAALTVLATDVVVLAFGGLAVVLGLLALSGTTTREQDHSVAFPPPEPADSTAEVEHVAETIDTSLERHEIGDDRFERGKRSHQRHEARTKIRRTAIDVLAERHDVSVNDAASRIDDGTWTDDPRAAAFLSTDASLPRRIRIVDWAYGARYHRGLEAAVEEIDRLDAARRGVDRVDLDTERETAGADRLDIDGPGGEFRSEGRLDFDQFDSDRDRGSDTDTDTATGESARADRNTTGTARVDIGGSAGDYRPEDRFAPDRFDFDTGGERP